MRLSDFIQQHRRAIVEEWVEFARTLTPWAKGLSKKDLRDHAEELISVGIPRASSQRAPALTGYAKDSEALAAAGFDGHLSKPVDFEQLGETLANVIAARREPPRP